MCPFSVRIFSIQLFRLKHHSFLVYSVFWRPFWFYTSWEGASTGTPDMLRYIHPYSRQSAVFIQRLYICLTPKVAMNYLPACKHFFAEYISFNEFTVSEVMQYAFFFGVHNISVSSPLYVLNWFLSSYFTTKEKTPETESIIFVRMFLFLPMYLIFHIYPAFCGLSF